MPSKDQVFILVGSTARFIPQRDEEILGPANIIGLIVDPKPPAVQIPLIYCNICGVNWLVGEKGPEAAADHPLHYTLDHIYQGTSRSLVVFIDGACPANGPAASQASIGIYFGPQSPKNISRLINTIRPINQLAEITAALEAMRQVRSTIVPERRALLKSSLPRNSRHAFSMRDPNHFRLILATDSSYLVDCMCEFMPQWTFDETKRVYCNRRGDVINNSEGFKMLYEETELLSAVGVQVQWYYIPRGHNCEADALANAALRKRR